MNRVIKELIKFNSDRNFGKDHTIKNLVVAFNVEAAELLELFNWDNIPSSLDFYDEIADCYIYLLNICIQMKLDNAAIQEIILRKIKKNEIKYPL